jgi:hypothetical protein
VVDRYRDPSLIEGLVRTPLSMEQVRAHLGEFEAIQEVLNRLNLGHLSTVSRRRGCGHL